GGAGYIGSHTAWLLAKHNYNILVLDTLYQKQPCEHSWATLIQGDFGDKPLLKDIFSRYHIAGVIHFGAFLAVGQSVKHPLIYYENNVVKTRTLLEAMVEHNVLNFVFSSSCAVYGYPQQLPLTEDHPRNPINPYGKTKYAVELMLEDCAQAYGLNYVSLRYFNAAGVMPYEHLYEWHVPETHLIPLLLRSALTNKKINVFGTDYATPDGTCVRDYIHVQDLASAHYKALKHIEAQHPSDVFNLGTGTGYSVQEVITAAQQVTKKEILVNYADRREGDPPILVADATKAANILNWKPHSSDIKTILKTAWIAERTCFEQIQKKHDANHTE
ncbi:MAG: UDP-glucose 4-epimerase, partial [Alteromonas naphthalenivorans]